MDYLKRIFDLTLSEYLKEQRHNIDHETTILP